MKTAILSVCLVMMTMCATAYAMPRINIAVVTDGTSPEETAIVSEFIKEIKAVTEGSYDTEFPERLRLSGDRTAGTAAKQMSTAENGADIVLAIGLVSGQAAVSSKELKKPTFVPYILKMTLADNARRKNLNFIAQNTDMSSEIDTFLSAVRFKKLTLIVDGYVRQLNFDAEKRLKNEAAAKGVALSVVYDTGGDLAAAIPTDTEAVMIAPLPNRDKAQIKSLAEYLTSRHIPAYAPFDMGFDGTGIMLTASVAANTERRARMTAVNLLEVLKGRRAEAQPVELEYKRKLIADMAAADRTGVSLPFALLSEAELINENGTEATSLTIDAAVREAIKANLNLIAAELGIKADSENIRMVRSELFPQISVKLGYTQFDSDYDYVELGSYAEKSTDGSVTLKQLLFSEKVLAQLKIQKHFNTALKYQQKTLELEVGKQAAQTFLKVLTAQTAVRIRQEDLNLCRSNLELAKSRVEAGVSDMSDVYNWQSRIATANQALLSAKADAEKARDGLNRILNRPIKDRYVTSPATLDSLSLTGGVNSMLEIITNERSFGEMAEYMVKQAQNAAPELKQIDENIRAQARKLESDKRAYWSPDIYAYGTMSHVFHEDREPFAGIDLEDESYWQAGLALSLPLFEGGSKSARKAQSGYGLDKLRVYYRDSRNGIEQNVMSDLHAVRASYPSIKLSDEAADAARKSYYIIRDNYAEGTRPMSDLLLAQNSSISADLASANAVYRFLTDLMLLQRDMGSYSLFLDEGEHVRLTDELTGILKK